MSSLLCSIWSPILSKNSILTKLPGNIFLIGDSWTYVQKNLKVPEWWMMPLLILIQVFWTWLWCYLNALSLTSPLKVNLKIITLKIRVFWNSTSSRRNYPPPSLKFNIWQIYGKYYLPTFVCWHTSLHDFWHNFHKHGNVLDSIITKNVCLTFHRHGPKYWSDICENVCKIICKCLLHL